MQNKTLPLRTGVGVVVLNSENKVFVGKRKDNPIDKWQMPQGGVDTGETLLDAAIREIYEETGIQNPKFIKPIGSFGRYRIGLDGNDDLSHYKTIHNLTSTHNENNFDYNLSYSDIHKLTSKYN